jgi:hypothetical protein
LGKAWKILEPAVSKDTFWMKHNSKSSHDPLGHWYKVTDLGVVVIEFLIGSLFIYKVNFNLLHNLASNLLQDKPGWFSGKSCAVTIPYVEVNSPTKFALECNEGLIIVYIRL